VTRGPDGRAAGNTGGVRRGDPHGAPARHNAAAGARGGEHPGALPGPPARPPAPRVVPRPGSGQARIASHWLTMTRALGRAVSQAEARDRWADYSPGRAPAHFSARVTALRQHGVLVAAGGRAGSTQYAHWDHPVAAGTPPGGATAGEPATAAAERARVHEAVYEAVVAAAARWRRAATTREVREALPPVGRRLSTSGLTTTLRTLSRASARPRPVAARILRVSIPRPSGRASHRWLPLATARPAPARPGGAAGRMPDRQRRGTRPSTPRPADHVAAQPAAVRRMAQSAADRAAATPGSARDAIVRAAEHVRGALGRPASAREIEAWVGAHRRVDPVVRAVGPGRVTHLLMQNRQPPQEGPQEIDGGTTYGRSSRRTRLRSSTNRFTCFGGVPRRYALPPVSPEEIAPATLGDALTALRAADERASIAALEARAAAERVPLLRAWAALRGRALHAAVSAVLPPGASPSDVARWSDRERAARAVVAGWQARDARTARTNARRWQHRAETEDGDLAAGLAVYGLVAHGGADAGEAVPTSGDPAARSVGHETPSGAPTAVVGQGATMAPAAWHPVQAALADALGRPARGRHRTDPLLLVDVRRFPPSAAARTPRGFAPGWRARATAARAAGAPSAYATVADAGADGGAGCDESPGRDAAAPPSAAHWVLDRVDAWLRAFTLAGMPTSTVLLAGASALLGHVVRDAAALGRVLAELPPHADVVRRDVVVALGLLGAAVDPAAAIPDGRDPHDVDAYLLACVLADPGAALGRVRALAAHVAGPAAVHALRTALMRLEAGEFLSVVG